MGGFAWVTLATNDSYSLGALVLAHSLKQAGTKQQLVVLITPGISEPMRQKLAAVFNVIQEVNILDSKDEANLKLLKRPELGITFTKLHCWRLTQFEKCVFLDADTLVVQNCDELFDREEFSAAPDVGWPDCFNSGVFVYRPSNETYDKLVQFALDKGSFDGGDQGLLNLYFSDWSQKDISKHLPFIYNMCSTACYSYLPAFKQYGANAKIVHFIGSSKPWLQYFDTLSRQVHPSGGLNHLQGLLQKWWDIFCNLIHPELSSSMARSYTDFPSLHPSITLSHPNKSINIETPIHDYRDVWDPWEDYSESQTLVLDTKDDTQFDSRQAANVIHHSSFTSYSSNTSHQSVSQINTTQDLSPKSMPFESHNTYNRSGNTDSHIHTQDNNQSQPESETTTSCCIMTDRQSKNVPNVSYEQSCVHNADKSETHSHTSKPCDPVQSEIINSFPEDPESNPFSVTPDKTSENHQLPASNVYKDTDTIDEKCDKGLAGAFAQLTLGSPRSAEQIALEDQLRRQSWEVGNIDYLGRDSFDNIWSKICETLATCPAVQAEPEVAAVPTAAPEVAAVPTAAPEVAAVPTTATKTEAKEQKAEETPKEEKAVQVLQQEPPKPDQVSETALNSEKPKDDPVLISPIPCTETSATAPTETQVAIPAAEVAKPVTEISAVKPEVVSTSTPKDDLPQVPPVAPLPAGTETVPVSEAPTKEEQKLLETAPVISEVPVVAPAQPTATTPPVVQSTPVPLDAQAVPPKDIQSSVEPPKQEQIPSTKASEQTKPADVQTIAATTEVPKDEKKADVVAPIENITAVTSPVDLPKKETTAVPVEAPKEEKTPILAEAPKDDKAPAESVKDVKTSAEAQTVAEAIKESVTPVVTETPKDSKTPKTEDTKATTPEVQKEAAATPTENKSLALTEVKTKLPEEPVGEVVKPGEGIEKLTETAKPPQEEKPATPITVDQTAPTESQQKSVAIPLGAPPSTEVPQTAEPVPEKIEPCKEVSKECTECPVVKETAQVTEVPKNVDTQVIKPENVPCKEESATKALEGKDSAKSGEEVPVSVAKASKECKESPECQTTCSKPTKCTKPDKESKQCSKSQPPKEDKKQIKEGAKVAEPQKESGDCKKPADQKPAPSQEKEQKISEAGPAKPVETPTPPPRKQGNGSGKKTGKPKK